MSALEWRRLGWSGAYTAEVNGLELFLHRASTGWWVRDQGGCTEAQLPGPFDLPDAEAQALAVPTLVKALKAVVAKLEGAA